MGPRPWNIGCSCRRSGPASGFPAKILSCWLCLIPFLISLPAQKSSLEQGSYRIEIVLEQLLEENWTAIDPGLVLPSGAFIRFRVRANFDGFLYAVNLGTNGSYSLLFPREESGLHNRVEADREYLIPALEGGFRIVGPPGYEIVYWLISPVELRSESDTASVPSPLPTPPAVKKPLGRLIPRCDDKMFRARGECIDVSAGPQTIQNKEQLPENLTAVQATATTRELEFSRRKETAVVSSTPAAAVPVLFEFRIAHR